MVQQNTTINEHIMCTSVFPFTGTDRMTMEHPASQQRYNETDETDGNDLTWSSGNDSLPMFPLTDKSDDDDSVDANAEKTAKEQDHDDKQSFQFWYTPTQCTDLVSRSHSRAQWNEDTNHGRSSVSSGVQTNYSNCITAWRWMIHMD